MMGAAALGDDEPSCIDLKRRFFSRQSDTMASTLANPFVCLAQLETKENIRHLFVSRIDLVTEGWIPASLLVHS